jgi:hypothetical protein
MNTSVTCTIWLHVSHCSLSSLYFLALDFPYTPALPAATTFPGNSGCSNQHCVLKRNGTCTCTHQPTSYTYMCPIHIHTCIRNKFHMCGHGSCGEEKQDSPTQRLISFINVNSYTYMCPIHKQKRISQEYNGCLHDSYGEDNFNSPTERLGYPHCYGEDIHNEVTVRMGRHLYVSVERRAESGERRFGERRA